MRATPDDILGMAFFARVVEARSFSDAARSLGMSKSAMSARVARLEARLGVRLLHRTTRRLALTADGVRLYERCARVVAEADEAAEVAAGASAVPRGTLRVHASPGLAQMHLTKPIGELLRAHQGLRIDLHLADRMPDFAVDAVDIAIVAAARLASSGLSTRKLASVRVAVCASPAYLRRKGIPFRPQDLVLHDCLSHSVLQTAEEWLLQTDEGPVSIANLANVVVDDTPFLREAALGGLGLAMLPEHLVMGDLAAGRLHRVLDDFQALELGIHAIHPHGQLTPASVRAFLDHLVAYFRHPPWARDEEEPTKAKRTKAAHRATSSSLPITEQDVRRLGSVAALYDEVDATSCAHLRERLLGAKVMTASKIPRTSVTMSSRVLVRARKGGDEHEISLVYPWDAAAAGGRDRTSILSPLGLALLGSSVGDEVAAEGDGSSKAGLTIVAIPYQPEAAGDHHL